MNRRSVLTSLAALGSAWIIEPSPFGQEISPATPSALADQTNAIRKAASKRLKHAGLYQPVLSDSALTSDVAQQFFAEVNKHARRFMSDEHFTVDGTLIQAWASQKSLRSDDGDGDNSSC